MVRKYRTKNGAVNMIEHLKKLKEESEEKCQKTLKNSKMDFLLRANKYILKKEYSFETPVFRGLFYVKKFKENKLPYLVYDSDGTSTNLSFDIVIDLKHCEWLTKAGYWHSPEKGFRRNKIMVNKHLKDVFCRELKPMLLLTGIPHTIDKITIKWLHENQI